MYNDLEVMVMTSTQLGVCSAESLLRNPPGVNLKLNQSNFQTFALDSAIGMMMLGKMTEMLMHAEIVMLKMLLMLKS